MEPWIDLHCDTLSALRKQRKETLLRNSLCVDLERLKLAGAGAQLFACYVNGADFQFDWDQAYSEVQEMIALAQREEGELFRLVEKTEDLVQAKQEGQMAGILTVEEGGVINGKLERISELYQNKVRLITLTWNYENCIGSPNSENPDVMEQGLTDFGRQAVERMNELGIVVDVSHLSDGGFYDCMQTSRVPVIASHSNARSLCPHRRNLSDEMLKILGEKGGVVGVNLYSAFLSAGRRAEAEDVARHVIHMIGRAGEDAVALGTDFDGFQRNESPVGLEQVTDLDLLWHTLQKAGVSSRQLDKIKSKNVNRLLKNVWKH